MRRLKFYILFAIVLLSSCEQRKAKPINMDGLATLKKEFLQQIYTSDVDEGPFSFNYKFRTIFFSKEVISLFGELRVHDRLPHGWQYYEGKTFCMIDNQFREVRLSDLFTTVEQREFLRQTCENSLKSNPISYFSGNEPLRSTLSRDDIRTFVVDDQHLIIIFQPYTVGGGGDDPFLVKIPFIDLKGHWEGSHPIHSLFKKVLESRSFISSWDLEQFYGQLGNDE